MKEKPLEAANVEKKRKHNIKKEKAGWPPYGSRNPVSPPKRSSHIERPGLPLGFDRMECIASGQVYENVSTSFAPP